MVNQINKVVITKDESIAHKLLPVNIVFEITGGLMISVFPGDNRYLSISSPPGGVFGISIESADSSTIQQNKTIIDSLKARRSSLAKQEIIFGATADCTINNNEFISTSYLVGHSHARTNGLILVNKVNLPANIGYIVIAIEIGRYSQGPTAEYVLNNDAIKKMLATLKIF